MKLASVLILEDDSFSLLTLKQALTGLNIEVKCATTSISDAINALGSSEIDVAILDLDLGPGANGVDVAYRLRTIKPNMGIVLLTGYSDPRLAQPNGRKLPIGSIFLVKSNLVEISSLISAILATKQNPLKKRVQSNQELALTDRQIEVLKALASGLSTKEISKSLGLSEKTVEATITKLHLNLGLGKDTKFNIRIQLARAFYSLSGRNLPSA